MADVRSTKDAIEFLIAEAKKKGGAVTANQATVNVRLPMGTHMTLIKIGPGGNGEAILPPVALGHDIGFGEYIIGFYIVGVKERGDAAPAGVLEVPPG